MTSGKIILNTILKRRGYSYAEMARRLGISRQNLNNMLRRKKGDLDMETFLKAMEAMDCCISVFDLKTGEEFPLCDEDIYEEEKKSIDQA